MSNLDIRNVEQLREQAETWRRQRGWTQLDMAQALHIGLQTYGNFKRGQSDLLRATRLRLVDLLNGKTNGGGNGANGHGEAAASRVQQSPGNGSHSEPSTSGETSVSGPSAFSGAPSDSEIVQALALAQMRQRPDYIQELGAMAVRLTRLKRLAEEERAKLDRIVNDLDRRNNGK